LKSNPVVPDAAALIFPSDALYSATDELKLKAVTIAVIESAGVDPEATKRVVGVFAGGVLPVTAMLIPLIEKDPVGVINGAKLALLIVSEAVVARIPLWIFVLVAPS
jgi:hypothetical protein